MFDTKHLAEIPTADRAKLVTIHNAAWENHRRSADLQSFVKALPGKGSRAQEQQRGERFAEQQETGSPQWDLWRIYAAWNAEVHLLLNLKSINVLRKMVRARCDLTMRPAASPWHPDDAPTA